MGGLKGETLSPVARTMKFKLTVRDNKAAGGGVASSGAGGCQTASVFQINVIATPGPFAVAVPNGGESYPGLSSQTITWNTVGTNNAPINCANVMISLSTDGGLTYPTVISASTPNDGSEIITIPNIVSTNARIKIEAIGNVFFDISNANFNITPPVNPTFTFGTPSAATVACGSSTAAVTITTTSVSAFSTPINLTASGNPVGTTVSYSVNPVTPGNSSVVTLNGVNTLVPGTYNVTVTGTAGAEVKNVVVSYVVNPPTGPVITTQPAPQTACAGSNAAFGIVAPFAASYQWQESTNGGNTWTNISNAGVYSGATSATLSLTGVGASLNNNQYRCALAGICIAATNSSAVVLTVNTPVTITAQPATNANICATGSTSFTTMATGTSLTYQWQVSTAGAGGPWTNITNGGNYSGATTGTLTLTAVTAAMNSSLYRAVVSGTAPCGNVNTGNALLNVIPQPVITASPTALQAGQQTTLSVNVAPAPGLSFAWYLNGVLIPGATGNSVVANVDKLGSYRVVVTTASGSCPSELKDITAEPSSRLFVFPSPNNGLFKVSYYTAGASATNSTTQSITIYDSYGRRVHTKVYPVSQAYQLHQIDMRHNGTGVYYIVLTEANGNTIKTGEVVVR